MQLDTLIPLRLAGTTLKASLFKDDKPVGKIFIDTIKFRGSK
jgi:hypothetical protein